MRCSLSCLGFSFKSSLQRFPRGDVRNRAAICIEPSFDEPAGVRKKCQQGWLMDIVRIHSGIRFLAVEAGTGIHTLALEPSRGQIGVEVSYRLKPEPSQALRHASRLIDWLPSLFTYML